VPDYRLAKDRAFTILVLALAAAGVAPLAHLLATVAVRGAEAIARAGPGFFTEAPAPPGSRELGGIAPALAGSLLLAGASVAIGVPLATLTAVFMHEFPESRLARAARALAMSLLEIPTVLVGILVYSIIVVPMGRFSLLAGGVALAIVMLPYVATYVERALGQVPRTYREAGLALGMTRAQVVFHVAMGVARRGVLAGFIVGLSKALGETAPLLFTIGGSRAVVQASPLCPGDAVPLLVFQLAQTPYENWRLLAWGASLVLVASVLLVYLAARLLVREVRL